MNTNRISATLSTADQEAVLAAIDGIRQKLPFLIDLTTAERVSIPKLGDKSQGFVRKALEIAVQNRGMLPASFDVEEMRRDAQLFDSLAPIQLAIDHLQNQLADTAIQAGGEAFAAARAVYAAAKTRYAAPALRTAAEELARRFGRKTRAVAAVDVSDSASSDSPDTAKT